METSYWMSDLKSNSVVFVLQLRHFLHVEYLANILDILNIEKSVRLIYIYSHVPIYTQINTTTFVQIKKLFTP
jgi:hypothetical protein